MLHLPLTQLLQVRQVHVYYIYKGGFQGGP
jgi:hypothetical protein